MLLLLLLLLMINNELTIGPVGPGPPGGPSSPYNIVTHLEHPATVINTNGQMHIIIV